ncbi:MAG: S8 family serine peptidase [Candidatus Dadabacteria bacterium]|nr:S8 family serine peptidase [Candidatus Dadabacteria bacterium]
MTSLRSLTFIFLLLASGGCDSNNKSEPPVNVSLVAPTSANIQEAENQTVRVFISLDSTASTSVMVPLNFSGSAKQNADYATSADSIIVPPNTTSASVDIDVFRDFDLEDDETITVSLGEIEGNGKAGTMSSISFTIIDGEAATVDKTPKENGANLVLLNTQYIITEGSIDFAVVVLNFSDQNVAPTKLFAEWSSDMDFETDVHSLGIVDTPAFVFGEENFPQPYEFSLPLSGLAPNETYYIRVYLDEVPEEATEQIFDNVLLFGFATNAEGKVTTRCEAPVRAASGTEDPLFREQWHLKNSGQSGFANNNGVAGADLQMTEAISNGQNGDGVKLAVVDTGLEICHPDLAATVEEGKSFNYAFQNSAGSSPTDPFNHSVLGDHGTSVAGVAAAVANNGLGGRGVAPGVKLRGFNLGTTLEADFEAELLSSLGGSSSNPDSASAHIFNMSFGSEVPSENSEEDFVNLVKMGTTDLRSGRGALYVKAAGNEFGVCENPHPINIEIGCVGSNSDPDQNLPYLINVGAFNARDVKSSYSSAGANLWVVAPGGEDGEEQPAIITTDQIGVHAGFSKIPVNSLTTDHRSNLDGDYFGGFGGTSSAAPATSGAIAILLGVNPDLTWRDVKHILATSARKIDPDIKEVRAAFNGKPYIAQHAWQINAAGYSYHNWYGFGAVSVDDAIIMTNGYTPNSLGEFVESRWFPAADNSNLSLAIPDEDGAGVTHTLTVTDLPNTANIEAVILDITVNHGYGSDLGVKLTSPSGTESIVNAPFNVILDEFPGMRDWQLMSNAFYGEKPNGTWTIQVADLAADHTGSLESWRLRFYYGDHP